MGKVHYDICHQIVARVHELKSRGPDENPDVLFLSFAALDELRHELKSSFGANELFHMNPAVFYGLQIVPLQEMGPESRFAVATVQSATITELPDGQ